VLAGGGGPLIVGANRRGGWARPDTTPFGHGRPYSRSQITHLLREGRFTPTGWGDALPVPPGARGWVLRAARAWGGAGLARRRAVGGRAHRRGDEAGLSRHSRAPPARAVGACTGACARAFARSVVVVAGLEPALAAVTKKHSRTSRGRGRLSPSRERCNHPP